MLFLYFCPFLDQQLNLCRQIPDFPHIGQIPGFSEPQVFAHLWTNPGLFSKSRIFFQNHAFFQNHGFFQKPKFYKSPNFTNPEFCMDKSRILHGQIPNFAWTNPEFCMDKSRILHGQIQNFAWTNPEFWTNPRYFSLLQNSVHFSKLPCF